MKLLWLAIHDVEDKRARQRAMEAGLPANKRKAPGRLVEGATTDGWKGALNHLELLYPTAWPDTSTKTDRTRPTQKN